MYVAIMGYGTIGSGVAEILEKNKAEIAAAAGREVLLKYVLDLREFPGSPIEDKLIHDFKIIEEDPEVELVVETMGGLNPAYPFVKACLLAGKHVATSNKALVAAYGTELLAIAREKQVNFLFEASVGGGIPVIRTLYRSMSGEKIERITGILNGTTNYILTRMSEEGSSFEAALKEAQDLGYAERNPEADVEGYDTCRKIAILTAMASGKEVNFEEIYTEGITRITDIDFKYAKKMGTCVKLFGSSRICEDGVQAWVAPVMIGPKNPLYAVGNVFNGILITSNMLGQTMLYGSGAGKLPTGGAVVADMIEAAQNPAQTVCPGWSAEHVTVAGFSESMHRYFVRIAGDYGEIGGEVASVFGDVPVIELDGLDEFAVLTEEMTEAEYQERAKKLEVRQMIRAESL